jgi:hypothetical protein
MENGNIVNIFEGDNIRSIWDNDKEDYYLSVIDVIYVLTKSDNSRKYWNKLKERLRKKIELENKLGESVLAKSIHVNNKV